jgi:hypothetical protein
MKTVRQEDLTRMALAKGASITVDGKAINASRERMDVPRLKLASPAPAPDLVEPAPAPPAVPAQIDTAGLERAAQASQHSTQQLLQLVSMLVQEVRSSRAPAMRGWDFEVQRDGTGKLSNIKARPLAEWE